MKYKFYSIEGAYKRGAFRIQSKVKYDTLKIIDESTPLIKENNFTVVKGKKSFDLVHFDDSVFFAISSKFKGLLEIENVTGWGSFPIQIEDLDDEYYGIYIKSKAGPILNLDALNNYETEAVEFDLSTWDGSDIFNLQDTLLYVCTARVREIIEKAKITNVAFRPVK